MKHFSIPNLPKQSFGQYLRFNAKLYRQSKITAKNLKGLPVIHINSTATGGGVAELLKTQVPLEKDLGLNSRWLVLREPKQFFFITKKMHNLLQGQKGFLSEPEKNYYIKRLKMPGQELKKLLEKISKPVVVVLHDPQVMPLIDYLPSWASSVIRLHIDLSDSSKTTIKFLRPFLEKADAVAVSHKDYRPSWLDKEKTIVSYPAINPFSRKNSKVNPEKIAKFFKLFGIDTQSPIIAQVSRFDFWKDPEGVIEAYYLAKKRIPKLQLVLEGAMEAKDDPEARGIFSKLKIEHQSDPDIFLHGLKTQAEPAYETWINALQRRADVVIQKSLREGFGLTVTEALWKGKAVIGGNALGIKAQIQNGRSGFIVNSPAECAKRIIQLIQNPNLAKRLGSRGQKIVRQNFLFNRLIFDFLKIYEQIASDEKMGT